MSLFQATMSGPSRDPDKIKIKPSREEKIAKMLATNRKISETKKRKNAEKRAIEEARSDEPSNPTE